MERLLLILALMVSCLFSQSIPQVLAQDQCEGNFDCDNDCDGTDAYTFKVDFGRSAFVNPCTSMNPCDGDFDCDGDVDGSNAYAFKLDFGRSAMNNPCPSICVDYDFWCKAHIADEYAQEIWGTSVARGVPLGISGEDGNLLSYAFPYALNADRFPTIEEILDAVRRVSAVYPKSDENFYNALVGEIGEFGSVEVAATQNDFPVLVLRHSLHPVYLNLEDAYQWARSRLDSDFVELQRIFFFSPHEEYFEFVAGEASLLLHLYTMLPPDEMQPIPWPNEPFAVNAKVESNSKVEEAREKAWQEVKLQQLPQTVKWLIHYKSVPVVDWTHWCVPTAMTMAAGYWDHFDGISTFTGYGRLFDLWKDHPAGCDHPGNNIPNFLDEIIDHSICTWSSAGLLGTINNTNQYNFTWEDIPGSASNDWGWPVIVSEVDNDRTSVWGVGPAKPHAMTVIGYRIVGSQKFVIVYNTWGASAKQQLAEYNYDQWSGKPNTDTGVGRLIPGGGSGGEHAVLTYPVGDEVLLGPTQIYWYVWGSEIQWTMIYYSTDGGSSWNFISPVAVPTQQGWNNFTFNFTETTTKGRVAIQCYSSTYNYIAGDGSRKNFFIQGLPDLVPLPGTYGFCQTDDQGRLIVTVKNQGTTSASSSSTKVEFIPGGTFYLNTPTIASGETAQMTLDIPSSCWNSDCDFRITVDDYNQVNEANEGNNSAMGACAG